MTARVQSVALANGVALQCVEQGDPSGIPVLLLHGVTDSWRSFEPVLPHLPDSIHAFALTQRGHGDASRPTSGYRYSDFSADVAAFMDATGLDSAVLVGHSMGRAIAQRFALDRPERALGLILIGAFAGEAGNPVIVEVEEAVSKLTDPLDPAFVREFQVSTLAQPVPPEFLETVVLESLKVPARVWRDAFLALRGDDVAAEAGKINAPTLVVSGDRDGFAPIGDVEVRTRTIPGARLAIYEGAGHGLHWEEPARFAADITSFMERSVAWRRS
ncbi:MAG TPA: alpha/beta hydrolase [Planctomycetota bacterium]|nr:alpha/beta hydrolase [Planctomycetota bacterium]